MDELRGELRSYLSRLAVYQEAAGDYAGAASTYEQIFTLPVSVRKQFEISNYLELNEEHLHYWFVMCRLGQAEKANKFLEGQANQAKEHWDRKYENKWLPTARFLLNKQSEEQLLKANLEKDRYFDSRSQVAPFFFIGMKYHARGDEKRAKEFYQRFLEGKYATYFSNESELTNYYLNKPVL